MEGQTDALATKENILSPVNLLEDEINQVNHFYQIMVDFFTNYSFQLVGALIIFIIGYLFAGKLAKVVANVCEKHKVDITLSRFLASTTKMLFVVLFAIIALGKLGVSITPFLAAIGAVSLGAGLALQGLLSNYAAGFNIILVRPFVVGDTVTIQGVTGVVKEVQLAHTIICDENLVEVTIPNKHIVGEVLHNSKQDTLLELSVGIGYNENPLAVIKLLEQTILEADLVSASRPAQIGINAFADSAIDISIRLWTPTVELHATKYQVNKLIYLALERENISIPYPQRDVHIITTEK